MILSIFQINFESTFMATTLGKKDIAELNEKEIIEVKAEYTTRLEAIERREQELANASLVEIQKIMKQKNVSGYHTLYPADQ